MQLDYNMFWGHEDRPTWSAYWGFGQRLVQERRFQMFPILYGIVLFISVYGVWQSLFEFVTLLYGNRSTHISIWRKRRYYVFSSTLLRKLRLMGSFVMLVAWLHLWYAVIRIEPSLMRPWMIITINVLTIEVINWLIEITFGVNEDIKLKHLLNLALPVINYMCVHCVKKEFLRALEENVEVTFGFWRNG